MPSNFERSSHGVGNGRSWMAKRGNVGVVIGRDRSAAARRESGRAGRRSRIPMRLMGLAQAGQMKAERPALFVEDTMTSDP